MKKCVCAVILLMAVSLLCCSLTACEDSRTGDYILVSASIDGEECDSAALQALGLDETTLTLKNDGTCVFSVLTEAAYGTWDDTTVTMSGETYQVSWEGNVMTVSRDNEEMRFVKSE